MPQTVQILRTASNNAPPALPQGALSVELSGHTKLWVGSHTGNRLLISDNPAELPAAGAGYLSLLGGTLSGNLSLQNNLINNLGDAQSLTDALNVRTADTRYHQLNSDGFLPLTGGVLSGNLGVATGITYAGSNTVGFSWNGSTVVASVDSTGLPGALATQQFALDQDAVIYNYTNANFLQLTGGTITGQLYNQYPGSFGPGGDAGVVVSSDYEAALAFNRNGIDAVKIGLDSLSRFAIGGWAWPLGVLTVDRGGNLKVIGSVESSYISSAAAVTAGNDVHFGFFPGGTGRIFEFADQWLWQWNGTLGTLEWHAPTAAALWGMRLSDGINPVDYLAYNSQGAVAGWGPYLNLAGSTGQHRNMSAAVYGLAEVLQITPMRFSRENIIAAEIGFLAEELQALIPEGVIETTIRDVAMFGIRDVVVLAAAVNAIKEIDARLLAGGL